LLQKINDGLHESYVAGKWRNAKAVLSVVASSRCVSLALHTRASAFD
jgi:hypothetical protein